MAQDGNTTPNNITFRQMVDTFETIATKHYQLQSFKSGGLDETDINKLDATDFPLLYVEPQTATVDAQTLTYSFDVIVADLIQNDMSDRDDAYTSTLLIIKDVISQFRQATQTKSWAAQRTDIELPVSLEPFTRRFANMLTGWAGTISVVVNTQNALCSVPQIMNT